ncbi:amidohydrolase [Hyphomonas adhaerens MHS-3]|uniref:Amidohydrolase n=3 Tax=Hyphomonas adhaerens TaxID=81029 RepID=A0A069E0T9_9PROT|nr:amidohydrolase [Hyphomonas adhaerens]KCZ83050.1 amidohydrolase [Hyphomonas adhaerens MHS-3]
MLRPTLISTLALGLALAGCSKNEAPSAGEPAKGAVTSTEAAATASETAAVQPAAMSVREVGTPDQSILDLYLQLHQAPELSFKEAKTSSILASELESLGFEVTTGVGQDWVVDKATRDIGEVKPGVGGYGVVGVFKNGNGPTVLIRTDMDALPVPEQTGVPYASTVEAQTWTGVDSKVMHACGHDVHMTAWLGTARALVAQKSKWKGTLVMIAQPAEEIGLGAEAMLADGLFERFPKPDYNLALHVSADAPSGTVVYSSGYAMANVDSVDIHVKGIGGHGAYPHTTRDPILIGSHIVTALQSLVSRNVNPLDSAVVTVGSFKAGAKHNIIPDEATLLLTVRSYDDDTRQMLLDGIERIAKAEAAAFDAPEPEITIETDYTPSTYNDPDTTGRAMKAVSKKLGSEYVSQVKPVMGGEDFSQYSRTADKIPSVLFWVGAVEPSKYAKAKADGMPLPSLHSSLFAPDYARTIQTGTDAMTAAALELFKD